MDDNRKTTVYNSNKVTRRADLSSEPNGQQPYGPQQSYGPQYPRQQQPQRKWYEDPKTVILIVAGILLTGLLVTGIIWFVKNTPSQKAVDDPYELSGSSSSSDSEVSAGGKYVPMSDITVTSDITCIPTTIHSTGYDSNMLDGEPTTAWQFSGKKTTRDVTATFSLPKTCILKGMRIRNGYQKRSSLFYANARPSWIRIVLQSPDGRRCVYYDGALDDAQGWQSLNSSNGEVRRFPVSKILLIVNPTRIYRGNRYSDVVISDVDFDLVTAR